ncbi:MAG: ATP synthase F1 subunit epsilon [Christensenellales bacterium]
MEKKKVNLRVVTPRGVKIQETADMIVMRCVDGDMGILPGHEPLSAALGDGILRVIDGDKAEQKIAVFGGYAMVENDTVNIVTSIAQRPGEIDLPRAEADRQQMVTLMQERADGLKMQSYQVQLRRALVRIEVNYHPGGDE